MLRFYTIADVAERLMVSERTVGRWAREGTLPAMQFGKLYRIPVEPFEAWLAKKRIKAWRPYIGAAIPGGPSSKSPEPSSGSRAAQLLKQKPSAECGGSTRKPAA